MPLGRPFFTQLLPSMTHTAVAFYDVLTLKTGNGDSDLWNTMIAPLLQGARVCTMDSVHGLCHHYDRSVVARRSF
jgi:hypothetical protein